MDEHSERTAERLPVGAEELAKAAQTLRRYAAGRAELTARITADERWWELRHREAVPAGTAGTA